MPIIIHQGDIFKLKTEALIVPANTQADLGWGSHVSEQLKKIISPKVLAERQAFGKLALGEACLTSGEGTPFKYLIHAAILDKYDFNPLFLLRLRQRTSDNTLLTALTNSAKILEKSSIATAAISAMGAGIGGMNYRKCVSMIFSTLREYAVEIHFSALKSKHEMIARQILEKIKKTAS